MSAGQLGRIPMQFLIMLGEYGREKGYHCLGRNRHCCPLYFQPLGSINRIGNVVGDQHGESTHIPTLHEIIPSHESANCAITRLNAPKRATLNKGRSSDDDHMFSAIKGDP